MWVLIARIGQAGAGRADSEFGHALIGGSAMPVTTAPVPASRLVIRADCRVIHECNVLPSNASVETLVPFGFR